MERDTSMNLVTLEYIETRGHPNIVLFQRVNRQRVMTTVSDFRPYLYKSYDPIDMSPIYQSIDGFQVQKKYTKLPQDVLQERKLYDRTWESDIKFTSRYLIDCVPKIDKSELRIQYTDIEVDIKSNRIMSIAVYDNYMEKCICFAWREDLKTHQEDKDFQFPSGYKFKATIHYYNSLKSLLSSYIKFIKFTDPDLLSGWYSTSFDFKYIINQINSVGLDARELSPLHKAYVLGEEVSKTEDNIKIAGRILWDMLKAYSFLQPGRLPSKSLEAIAQKELGEGKHPHKPFAELWKDMDELVKYNCFDAVLVARIDAKKGLINYYDTLRRFVGCEFHSLFYETLVWDSYVCRKLHNKLVLPSKTKKVVEIFKGAKVLQPAPKGIHNNVILLDLKSLYPNIIITFNLSPETLTNDKNLENCNKLPNGLIFKKDKIGIIPEVLLELMELRSQYKLEMKKFPFGTSEYESLDYQQTSIKVLFNALYGALAYGNFRLCTPEIASTITFVGRNVLEFIVKTVESFGLKVILGDTDSVFFESSKIEPQDVYKEMQEVVESINAKLPQFIKDFGGSDNCTIRIEPKKIYKSLMISEKKSGEVKTAKKRYGGLIMFADDEWLDLNSEKALDVVGFESKRSDSSTFSRDVQRKVIRMLLEGKPKSDQKAYIETMLLYLNSGEVDYEYVGIPRGLSQSLESYKTDSPHRRAAIYSNKYLGMKYSVGDKPRIIYVASTGKYPKTDVVAFSTSEDLPKDFKMDVNTMIDKSITMKLEHILAAANIDINELLHEHRKLGEYF